MKKDFLYYGLILFAFTSFSSCSDDDNVNIDDTIILEDSKPSVATASQGFYVVNEDWFGHDDGSVNYFKNDGSIAYRAYRAANNNEKLGVTSQFATIYGGNVYFVSKQGNRFVVADANTLKKKAVLTDIKGDGRSFLGVNPSKGYIGTSKGISIFNISNMEIEETIPEISGEVGNMCQVGNYAFAIVKSKGAYVINTTTDKVEKLIEGTDFAMLTQSKDGNVWIGANKKLIQLNPYTFEMSEVDITDAPLTGTWFAWNAGSLCASTQENVLYWTKGSAVVKYNVDKKELNTSLYILGKDDADKQLAFYGAGLRVDPLTDKLVLTVKRSGWGEAGSYNWLHVINNLGVFDKSIEVRGDNGSGAGWGTGEGRYFWFPAMPFFQDVNAPEILVNQIILKPNERKAICLNDKVVDADNSSASIIKRVLFDEMESLVAYELKQDSLIITSKGKIGKTKFNLTANSNGKTVEKAIRLDIRE